MNSLKKYMLTSAALSTLLAGSAAGQDRIRVVTTLPTYAAIAKEVAGDRADVEAIARGDVDPHFVNARPSYAAMLRRADLFVTTGLDLELWVPSLLDRANNSRILDGAPGQVVAYSGVKLRDIPESASRSGGDVHVFGNPHIHTDPANAVVIARNVTQGLIRIDGANRSTYERNLADFEARIADRLFGAELTGMVGAETLLDLAIKGEFWSFAESQQLRGRPLTDYLGGWLGRTAGIRGRDIVCYHKNWAYFSHRFRVHCGMYVEVKPGIPPTPGHVGQVIRYIRENDIPVILAANYYSQTQVNRVAERTGATAVIVPFHEEGEEGVDTYFKLVDTWIERLVAAIE